MSQEADPVPKMKSNFQKDPSYIFPFKKTIGAENYIINLLKATGRNFDSLGE
jgi:hypothetical protein